MAESQPGKHRGPRRKAVPAKAIALTIDTVGLTKAITWGTGTADNAPIPAASPFHGLQESRLRHPDVVQARRLLQEAGYDGRAIQLITSRRDPQMFDTAVVIQAMAAQAGRCSST